MSEQETSKWIPSDDPVAVELTPIDSAGSLRVDDSMSSKPDLAVREVGLRQATEADLPSIQRVIAAAYDKYLTRMDRPPAPLLRDYGRAVDTGAVWVTGSPVIGLISLTQTDDTILIENIAIHPDQQGNGLGRRLMEFAEDHARKHRVWRLALYTNEVMTENQAIYARLGYRVVDRRVEDGYRRIYMEKTLPAPPRG